MNKKLLSALIALTVITVTFLSAGIAYASPSQQETRTDQSEQGWGQRPFGYCQDLDGQPHCDNHEWRDGFLPMMSLLIESLASETDLTVSDIESLLLDGEHLIAIAIDAGLTQEDFYQLHTQIQEQFWQDMPGYRENWEDRPSSRFGWMNRMLGRFFDSENWGWPIRGRRSSGFGSCHR